MLLLLILFFIIIYIIINIIIINVIFHDQPEIKKIKKKLIFPQLFLEDQLKIKKIISCTTFY
jgi:hypothetical protein